MIGVSSIGNFNNSLANNATSFKGNRLLSLPVCKRKFGFLSEFVENGYKTKPCYFTELTQEDIPLLNSKACKKFRKTEFGDIIIDAFNSKVLVQTQEKASKKSIYDLKKSHFYMLETNEKKKKVLGLVFVQDTPAGLHIECLQALTPHTIAAGFKGVGSALLYGVVRVAQQLKKSQISLVASDATQNWYRQKRLNAIDRDLFVLWADAYKKFFSQEEELMKISHQAFIKQPKM